MNDKIAIRITIALCLVLIGLGLFAVKAAAADVQFDWQLPTTREDGTALEVTEIRSTEILCAGAGLIASVPAPAITYVMTNVDGFNDTCYAIVTATGKDDGTGQAQSQPSVSVQVVVPKSLADPSPAVGFGLR